MAPFRLSAINYCIKKEPLRLWHVTLCPGDKRITSFYSSLLACFTI
uniref:Uncharacterized protein n=1 Tax=Siphoviridae sp. ctVDy27 TaxID=2827881 RepID=A0A8S5S6R8_9CAUD|nr:MAG TPA: hypothetical protein [Siphoviridae sp. ctVDy27]